MNSFKKLINLIKQERGKIFVTDTEGEQTFVLMSLDEYQKIRAGQKDKMGELSKRLTELTEQTEELNKQITAVQLQELSDDFDLDDDFENLDEQNEKETLYVEPITD